MNWKADEREQLYQIALNNTQVGWIITDNDISAFYKKLLAKEKKLSKAAEEVKRAIEG